MRFDTTFEFTRKNQQRYFPHEEDIMEFLLFYQKSVKESNSTIRIVKGQYRIILQKELRFLNYVKEKKMFIYCQLEGWCTTNIFKEQINDIVLIYHKGYCDKYVLIMDNTLRYISKDSLQYLDEKTINYIIIYRYDTHISTFRYLS